MKGFYLNDGIRPGKRIPAGEYGTESDGIGSQILNEAQAAKYRGYTPTKPPIPPGITARYVRIIQVIRDHSNYFNRTCGLSEVQVWSDGVNVAAGKPGGGLLVNGVTSTVTAGQVVVDPDVTIDLGATFKIDSVTMFRDTTIGCHSTYRCLGSHDGTTWFALMRDEFFYDLSTDTLVDVGTVQTSLTKFAYRYWMFTDPRHAAMRIAMFEEPAVLTPVTDFTSPLNLTGNALYVPTNVIDLGAPRAVRCVTFPGDPSWQGRLYGSDNPSMNGRVLLARFGIYGDVPTMANTCINIQ